MRLEFFEPTMCCSTGICGASVDKKLVKLAENIKYLTRKFPSLQIYRYQPQTHTLNFISNKGVMSLLNKHGNRILPIIVLDGNILKYGSYPSLKELLDAIEK